MVSMNGSGSLNLDFGTLVLSRRRDEAIEFQDERGNVIAEVVVAEVRGDKVRLACRAPKERKIHRREVADAIRRERMGNAG